jgi:ribosomal protein S18 acetylase RimI-like enzyme
MLSDFARHSGGEQHWQLGPVGVSPDAQGTGIGTLMVEVFCAHVDSLAVAAVLATDNENNVRLYEKSGFVTQIVGSVIGVPMWFMLRPAKT